MDNQIENNAQHYCENKALILYIKFAFSVEVYLHNPIMRRQLQNSGRRLSMAISRNVHQNTAAKKRT